MRPPSLGAIFMITAPMIQRGIDVNLPVARRSNPIVGERIEARERALFEALQHFGSARRACRELAVVADSEIAREELPRLRGGEERRQVALQPRGFAAQQLARVRIFLLWHQR